MAVLNIQLNLNAMPKEPSVEELTKLAKSIFAECASNGTGTVYQDKVNVGRWFWTPDPQLGGNQCDDHSPPGTARENY